MTKFKAVMLAAGLQPPEQIEPGKIYRFPGAGKRNGNAGWCQLFPDMRGGVFGDWSTGLSETWQAKREKPMTDAERAAFQRHIKASREQAHKEKVTEQRQTAIEAQRSWKAAQPASTKQAYLKKKRIQAQGLRQEGNKLLVPMRDDRGKIWALQTIANDGGKLFQPKGCRTKGLYYAVGGKPKPGKPLCIAEGFATAATIHESTGYPVAVTFSAGNLQPVAEVLKMKLPDVTLILCADDDQKRDRPDNPGIEAAEKAGLAVGGKVAYPGMGKKSDFWDLWHEQGPEAVRTVIDNAQPIAMLKQAKIDDRKPQVRLVCATELTPEEIVWQWRHYLAKGKLEILAGPPGTGKTTIALSLAASISCGGSFPDGSSAAKGKILIWSGEDDPTDTLLPRLLAMGADPKNIIFIDGVTTGDEITYFDPARHMETLTSEIERIGTISLLVLDPIVNAVAGDSHKNTEVRRALQPVVNAASKKGFGVLGITHFSKGTAGKNPVERVTGSIAFGALARMVFAAVKVEDNDGDERRLFVRAKSNIGPDGGGFSYTIRQRCLVDHPEIEASYIEWLGPVEGEARELLAQAEAATDVGEKSSLSEAQIWLSGVLADAGEMGKNEIMELAKKNDFAKRTIYRAREKLKVAYRTEGFGADKKSIWFLPPPNRANQENKDENRKVGTIEGTRMNKGFGGNSALNRANKTCTEKLGTIGTIGENEDVYREVI